MTATQFLLSAIADLEPEDWVLIAIIATLLYFTLREPVLAVRQQLRSLDDPGSPQ